MFESYQAIAVFLMAMTIAILWFGWPFVSHYLKAERERDSLEKRYNRLWRARKETLVSIDFVDCHVNNLLIFQGHLDWAISRSEPVREIE